MPVLKPLGQRASKQTLVKLCDLCVCPQDRFILLSLAQDSELVLRSRGYHLRCRV